ncbi:MAG: dihydroneopterin aldolase [candidate division Zixibacteria bacterium]|nr:dihydroneopterin aldolase [candidate division Zixibacteria bacterium]
MGIIRLHNMIFYGFHGVSPAEKETGRRFEVDIELSLDLSKAERSDRLKDTVNYKEVYQTVHDIIIGEHFSLLEAVSSRIADAVLQKFKPDMVRVRVRKKIPPVPGNLDDIEVEIERRATRGNNPKG